MKKTLKVLVVEDERIVAEDIRRSLRKMGYQVLALASSGEEAIAAVQKSEPDIILMDIVLKGSMSGIDTAESIRADFDIPVIYVTAYADEHTLEKAKITEPYGYILKPLDDRELQSTIEMATYRHKMEKRLRQRESWFSTTLRSIGDGVIAADNNENVTFMNTVAEKLTGWSQAEATGKSIHKVFQFVTQDNGEPSKDPLHVLVSEGESGNNDHRVILISRDGREIPIEETFSPIIDTREEKTGIVVVFRDITERLSAEQSSKLAEEALRESEERYRSLFEESRDAIYITTRKGNFVIANQSTMELFNFTKDEMIRLNIRELYNNIEDWKKFQLDIEEKGSVRDYEVVLKNKEGNELNCLLTSSVRRTKNGKILGYQGIIRDITEKKRAEEEKEKMQEQLLQAQKMEAVGILAGGIAHDFNNILTVIQGNSDLSLLKLDESDPIYSDLKEIQAAAMRAADLTAQLLLFSRKKPMRFETININHSIEGLLKMLHRLIGEDIGVAVDLEPDLRSIQADRGTLEQVIMNLAVNARDAMPKGGQLKIKSDNVTVDGETADQLPDAKSGQFVRLRISDSGVGINKETMQHIFEPFFSTKGTGRGTGLGLSVVYGIVKQHSGWIHVSSKEGKGTTFDVYMPIVANKSDKSAQKTMDLEQLQGDGRTILVVEDEIGVQEFTAAALRENGYIVYGAYNAKEGLEIYNEKENEIDLILSDVVLADKTGIELVDEILKKNPDLHVLLSSGYTGQKSQWYVIQQRGFHFLQKPYSMVDLLRAVRKALKK